MVTQTDEGKGLVKTYWANIRDRVAKIEPLFTKIVDELAPDKTFPLYLAYYPYGDLIGDTETLFVPKIEGGYYRLSGPNAPKDVIKHLGYGKDSAPLAMLLSKRFESFIDLKQERISIPRTIYTPGAVIPFTRILSRKKKRTYSVNGILTATSGARSVFMLPNIGCATQHCNLQRDFNVQSPPPKRLYDHWDIFRQIVQSNVSACEWRACFIFFSQRWLDHLTIDKAWLPLRLHLHELAWDRFEYDFNSFSYDNIFSIIQKKRNLKPNPYLADTARHLFTTASGSAPGYSPACHEDALPLKTLQAAFVESYGLKKYFPTILQPVHFNFETDTCPVYYSLQNPSTHVFSPKSREVSSTLAEMRELQHLARIFAEELAREDGMCSDTIMCDIAKHIRFNYFHNKVDFHRIIQPSTEIVRFDKRFTLMDPKYKISTAKFASDAPFVRGCISISR
jgi:hypothetical protein